MVDYADKGKLVEAMQGVHTLLSFIGFSIEVHKNLIDAAIVAGVKRFAPSEYARSVCLKLVIIAKV